ncbi:uncharacterized protein LOC131048456 isoform X1 [Cryptomeria japonica]|uniref:uncharacterized protein LOC131048456 isoform X1 n=1 Tax=Cryptomeria japonica TaxID=3369 RepID=UPI0025AC3990|nr:uncharacterized protein LOC131048456 isoform X1 [Cryptomeria japonica]
MAIEQRKDLEDLLVQCFESHSEGNCSSSHKPSEFDWNPSLHVKNVTRTIRTLQLDHSQRFWSLVSWIVGFMMILVIPILRLIYVKPADNEASHQISEGKHQRTRVEQQDKGDIEPTSTVPVIQLVFQPFVVVIGILISSVSFIFFSQSTRKYGIQGILYLDMAAEETVYIREEYNKFIQRGATKLLKLFTPVLVLYILQKGWFYIDVPLASLPHLNNRTANIVIISMSEGISWVYQTTTFLYACILFWKVCYLQELKMQLFKEMLLQAYDPELYYIKYTGIIKCLQSTSRRFRLFLALTGSITIFSALASMYVVVKDRHGIGILLSGELVVLNLVNLTGIGLCLHSASKVAHLHRRIVKAASSMHAKTTFATSKCYISSQWKDQSLEFEEKIQLFSQAQDAWSQRSALVNFISNNNAGISVYGFVLDRFFVHTSIASVLTTMWFIVGQSLSSSQSNM